MPDEYNGKYCGQCRKENVENLNTALRAVAFAGAAVLIIFSPLGKAIGKGIGKGIGKAIRDSFKKKD